MEKNIFRIGNHNEIPINQLIVKLNGYLMSKLQSDFVDKLHLEQINPFSQKLINYKNEYFWDVSLLTSEMINNVNAIENLTGKIKLDSLDYELDIERVEKFCLNQDDLNKIFLRKKETQYFTIKFDTPTSFKSDGEYVIMPTTKLIFQSLLSKYLKIFENKKEMDVDLLFHIVSNTKIIKYKLRSSSFRIHNNRIPSFVGEVTIKCYGTESLKSFVSVLLSFAEFSGIGIKTGLGMGGVTIG